LHTHTKKQENWNFPKFGFFEFHIFFVLKEKLKQMNFGVEYPFYDEKTNDNDSASASNGLYLPLFHKSSIPIATSNQEFAEKTAAEYDSRSDCVVSVIGNLMGRSEYIDYHFQHGRFKDVPYKVFLILVGYLTKAHKNEEELIPIFESLKRWSSHIICAYIACGEEEIETVCNSNTGRAFFAALPHPQKNIFRYIASMTPIPSLNIFYASVADINRRPDLSEQARKADLFLTDTMPHTVRDASVLRVHPKYAKQLVSKSNLSNYAEQIVHHGSKPLANIISSWFRSTMARSSSTTTEQQQQQKLPQYICCAGPEGGYGATLVFGHLHAEEQAQPHSIVVNATPFGIISNEQNIHKPILAHEPVVFGIYNRKITGPIVASSSSVSSSSSSSPSPVPSVPTTSTIPNR
jgi:hypothetical protein